MTSQEPDSVYQDFFAAEVQLFQADVDLALRGGLVALTPTSKAQDTGNELPADLGQWPPRTSAP